MRVNLGRIRLTEQKLKAMETLIGHIQHDVHVWDQGTGYQRHGRLTYFKLIYSFKSTLEYYEQKGYMSPRQLRHWREIQKILPDMIGIIKTLEKQEDN